MIREDWPKRKFKTENERIAYMIGVLDCASYAMGSVGDLANDLTEEVEKVTRKENIWK